MAEPSWEQWRQETDLDEYETRWLEMQDVGHHVHGEADFITTYNPTTMLDAGCGMGRVAIEMQRRGVTTVGVDADQDMLTRAMRLGPELSWHVANLAELDLGQTFDVVAMPGNVIPFASPESRPAVVAGCARHLAPNGLLIAGFSLRPDWPSLASYDDWCDSAGLQLVERFASWDRTVYELSADYAVSVHQRTKSDQ